MTLLFSLAALGAGTLSRIITTHGAAAQDAMVEHDMEMMNSMFVGSVVLILVQVALVWAGIVWYRRTSNPNDTAS